MLRGTTPNGSLHQHFEEAMTPHPHILPSENELSGNTGELRNVYPSGYIRNKVPSWHLLYQPFLKAMVLNMMRGEKLDGPGNPPNFLKATPFEDRYTFDHLINHTHDAIIAYNEGDTEQMKADLVSAACNAMIIYQTLCDREGRALITQTEE